MKRKKILYLWAVLFVLCITMFPAGTTANAASQKAVKSVTVRADKKKITKKTYALEIGESKSLKVTASPKGAVKSTRFKSNKPKIVAVSKKGKVTAKNKGTAKIQITVTGKDGKKKAAWVKIKVTERKPDSQLIPVPTPTPTPEPAPMPPVPTLTPQDPTPVLTPQTPDPKPEPERSKILVAYFSATNTTERLAEFIADGLPADLYEIVPEIPYTSADLNYGDSSSRTSVEMNDPTARPAISGSVADMGQYDTVFLGYPIWWGEAPRIVNTFLESYDFSGKTIIPFCTSGSSGIGSSAAHLHSLTDGAQWLSGRRFGSSATRNDMITWVNGLGLGFEAE